eukprot:7823574-Alexandrium_andersonii.AAC.1
MQAQPSQRCGAWQDTMGPAAAWRACQAKAHGIRTTLEDAHHTTHEMSAACNLQGDARCHACTG